MATTTLVLESSPDVAIAKTEVFDVDVAAWILNNASLGKDDKLALQRYYKKRENGNSVSVTYKLGKDIRNEFLGRLCAVKSLGLQCLPRDIRNALGSRYYWDVDVANAQPVLLQQYCRSKGFLAPALEKYIQQREMLLNELAEFLETDRDDAKQRVVSLLFGANGDNLNPFFAEEFQPEIRRLMKNVFDANASQLRFLNGRDNRFGKALAYILQTEERKVLLALDRAVGKSGRTLSVLIHDGGLVRKNPNEEFLPRELLLGWEKAIEEDTGYRVSLVVKPMTSSFQIPDGETESYETYKAEFEKTHFKLNDPPCFVRLVGKKIQFLTNAELYLLYKAKRFGDEKFLDIWTNDENQRTYEGLTYLPKGEAPAGYYNIFTGFETEPAEGDWSAVAEVLNLLSNGDPVVYQYIENWVASIFQRPTHKNETALVVEGEEGVGKDTYFNFVGSLMGDEYFFNTSRPEEDVFARFNGHLKKTLLLKFEEAKYATNKANADDLKSLITSKTRSYEDKGVKTIQMPSYINLVMTTNHEIPVVVSETNRRFVLIQASSKERGNFDFWERIHSALARSDVRSAYLHHLLSLDLTGFNPRNFPKTEYYNEVKKSFRPYHAIFFQRRIEDSFEGAVGETISARELYRLVQTASRFEVSETKFGRDLREYDSVIQKIKRSGNHYHLDYDRLRSFLQQKGWWVEL